MLEKEEIPAALPIRGQLRQIETFTEDALYCTANLCHWNISNSYNSKTQFINLIIPHQLIHCFSENWENFLRLLGWP